VAYEALNRRTIVLKKAGVAVGIATAALLAITPLAFADEDSQPAQVVIPASHGSDWLPSQVVIPVPSPS
jgi:hypothetical protein